MVTRVGDVFLTPQAVTLGKSSHVYLLCNIIEPSLLMQEWLIQIQEGEHGRAVTIIHLSCGSIGRVTMSVTSHSSMPKTCEKNWPLPQE